MKNFLQDLQRRNVIKAAVTYAVVSWAILQVFNTVFPLLDIEPSVLKTVLYILLAGFPFWLIAAYLFEWTPDGLKKTAEGDADESVRKGGGKKQNILIITGLSVAVLLLAADRFFEFSGNDDGRSKKSIAVLPFENMSSDNDAYFAAGVTEDILTQISKIGDLRVLSRFTLKEYTTKGKNVQQIGEELGVGYLLTGSIRRAGEQLRISCQLVQVNPEQQAWAETYDKQMADVFTIQANVAHEVAKNLRAKLTTEQKERIEKKPTENLEAYNYYLLASSQYDNGQSDDNERAIVNYRKALTLDSKFLPALTGLIRAYNKSINNYGVRQRSFNDTTFLMAQEALSMDAGNSEALFTMSYQHLLRGEYAKAIELADNAVELNPNYSAAINGLGLLKRNTGKVDEAFSLFLQARALEPLKINIFNFNLGTCCRTLGMNAAALEFFESVVDSKKSEVIALEQIGLMHGRNGAKDLVAQSINRMLKLQTNTKNLDRAAGMAFYGKLDHSVIRQYAESVLSQKDFSYRDHPSAVLAKSSLLLQSGKKDSAQMLLNRLFDTYYSKFADRDEQGGIYLSYAEIEQLRGSREQAMKWIEKMMVLNNVFSYDYFKHNHLLKPFHDQPDVRAWMDRMEDQVTGMREKVLTMNTDRR